jgi:hypothetical protein
MTAGDGAWKRGFLRRPPSSRSARSPAPQQKCTPNYLILNDIPKKFGFLSKPLPKPLDSPNAFPYVLPHRRRALIDAGPRRLREAQIAQALLSTKSRHNLVFAFRGLRPFKRKQRSERFAVLRTCGFCTSLLTEKGCAGGGLARHEFDVKSRTSQLRILEQ